MFYHRHRRASAAALSYAYLPLLAAVATAYNASTFVWVIVCGGHMPIVLRVVRARARSFARAAWAGQDTLLGMLLVGSCFASTASACFGFPIMLWFGFGLCLLVKRSTFCVHRMARICCPA